MKQSVCVLFAAFLAVSATPARAQEEDAVGNAKRVCGQFPNVSAEERAKTMEENAQKPRALAFKPSPPDPSNASGFREPNDRLFLVSLDNKQRCSKTDDGRCKWGLDRPIVYQVRGTQDLITVPSGFTTDLASIPSIVWPLLPPDGPWLKAAVIHDFLYKTCGKGAWDYQPYAFTRKDCTPDKPCYTRDEADRILDQAMEDRGVGSFKRGLIYTAVHLFGGHGWGR